MALISSLFLSWVERFQDIWVFPAGSLIIVVILVVFLVFLVFLVILVILVIFIALVVMASPYSLGRGVVV
jgi:hypothetical protein